jgi:protein-disulfide isomerase
MAGGYILYLPEHQNFNYVHLKSENDYIIGDESAAVNIYIFTDYDCPYCAQLANEV